MSSLFDERLATAKSKAIACIDDGDVGLVVRYKGAQASATVEVSSAGDITFKHGALSSEVVDTTIDSGGDDAGVIDVSDANANTFGEVVDLINASANWEAYLVGVLRADNSNASTGSLLTLSATQAKKTLVPSGVNLYKDTSKVLNMSLVISHRAYPEGFTRSDSGKVNRITGIISTNTFGSGTSKIRIYEINPVTQVETLVYEVSGGATTVQQLLDSTQVLVDGDAGNYLMARLIGSVACTGVLTVLGKTI